MKIFGQHDAATLQQLEDVAKYAEYTALMADGHRGYVMPIGGVAAYDNAVSVTGVGFDIACGNAAIQTDLMAADLKKEDWQAVANQIQRGISFGIGRSNDDETAPVDHPLFTSAAWDAIPGKGNRASLFSKAKRQLGTVGSGNHYVDIFADTMGRAWVGVHFGSRGLGHTIASGFLALGAGEDWGTRIGERETIFKLNDPLGEAYWALMQLAGEYAYAGREWVARRVVSMLGANEVKLVHNHHNFAWKEQHFGRELVVVRKGATPAFPGQQGFVGGSMGDDAVIVEGSDSRCTGTFNRQREAMFSTVHGAGRVMGRQDAKKGRAIRDENNVVTGRDESTIITPEAMLGWVNQRGVVIRGGDVDEAPQAYRRLTDVIAAQGDTIRVVETLTPLVVVMAGKDVRDPYKD